MVNYKNEILKLREEGLSYNDIRDKLGCSKSTISYHCKRWSLNNIGLSNTNISKKENEIKEYYKNHTKKETSEYFKISESSVTRYGNKKNIKLTIEEKKKRNYIRVSDFRQRLKKRAIEYKGGECMICGYNKSNRSLDFHHKTPSEKDFGIGSSKILSWEKIKKELDKCDLLCKNCHGELHDELDNQIHLK